MSATTCTEDYAARAASVPEIGRHFARLYRSFWSLESLPAATLELCRLRLAQLLASEPAWQHSECALPSGQREALSDWPTSKVFSSAERACLAVAEVHAMDAAAITDAQAEAVKAHFGDVGYVALVQALGVFDAVTRLGLIWGLDVMEVVDDGN
jgi:alkylhydroperoxidase family enzyme